MTTTDVTTTDYHDWTHPGTSKEKRKQLNVGDIFINAAECGECGYFIRSRNKHDYVTCKCGNVSVDGGSWYAKRSFKTDNYKNIIVLYDDVKETN